MDTPKEVADYMMKIGARIPSIKPGRRTIEYLTKVQASTRFWGNLQNPTPAALGRSFCALHCSSTRALGLVI